MFIGNMQQANYVTGKFPKDVRSVVDPNSKYTEFGSPIFWPNFNPDPGLYYRSIKTIFLNKGSFFKFIF